LSAIDITNQQVRDAIATKR